MMDLGYWLPLFFAGAMGLALLIYVILDGYDLGICMLLPFADDREKDVMVAAIGSFWEAMNLDCVGGGDSSDCFLRRTV